MLNITVPAAEYFDDSKEEFIYVKETTLCLEHSLVSLSKWESKWNKPFLSKSHKTREETLDYIRCMTITQNVNPLVYLGLTAENIEQINNYIDAPMTATWFSKSKKSSRNQRVVTSEIIYYWMLSLNIPFECQKWHLNRLLTLIQVCNEENNPQKKSQKEAIADRRALNARRKKEMNTKG